MFDMLKSGNMANLLIINRIILHRKRRLRAFKRGRAAIGGNGWQLNADFVFHKICDLGAVSFSCLAWDLETI